ncbi:MAG: OmpW family outer membrane protein [Thermoanaerobaculia bacterium]
MRIVFVALFLLAAPVCAFAQSEGAVWISFSEFQEETALTIEGDEYTTAFDEDTGYGVSFTHYWMPQLATEFTVQTLGGTMSTQEEDQLRVVNGEIDLTVWSGTAQWHFRPNLRFDPYVGAGGAFITGEFDPVDPVGDPANPAFDLENELTWLANAGVTLWITQSVAITGDVKYIAYDAVRDGAPDETKIDVNPLVWSIGGRVRF